MTVSRVRMIESLGEVERGAWDRLANPPGAPFDPFITWDFLQALEQSGCVSEETGWAPRHLVAEGADGEMVGALPLYLKSHSYGEYVFDHAWANALERAGGQYYPKLLTMVPFTPVTGRRILSADDEARSALVEAAPSLAREWGLSSWHVLFPDERDAKTLHGGGLAARSDIQFIWHNRGYGSYDDFLADLASRKRKGLKKEREAANAGVEIVALTGDALTTEHWDVFFACYQDTGARKWGTPYLNRAFFQLIHERMADHVWMVMARREGRWIAAALNFIGGGALYGRYWGCLEGQDSLHFELCYHRAIEYAIAHGLKRVEAGAQGHHKLARGYRPTPVGSAHFITHPGFDEAVRRFLRAEQKAVMSEIASLDAEGPFRRD